MRWRWLDLAALPALACLVESLWLSVAAALIAGVSWPLMLGGTLAVMSVPASATLAARAARLGTRPSRVIVGAAALGSVATLVSLQSHTPIGRAAGLAVADTLFVVVASWLAIRIGGTSVGVDEALGRAARGFGLVFVVLLCARLAHQPLTAAGAAVTGVVAAAALLVALARWSESLAMTDRRYGVSGWTWLAGIVTTIAVILLIAVVLAALTPARLGPTPADAAHPASPDAARREPWQRPIRASEHRRLALAGHHRRWSASLPAGARRAPHHGGRLARAARGTRVARLGIRPAELGSAAAVAPRRPPAAAPGGPLLTRRVRAASVRHAGTVAGDPG